MKAVVLCLIVICYCLFCVGASRSVDRKNEPCGDYLTWTFNAETQTLVVEGTGEMYDFIYNLPPWDDIRASIRIIEIKEGVTSIGNYSFNCTNLTTLSIPSSLTSIRAYAFEGCSNLAEVSIPKSVESIGFYAFKGCSNLAKVSIASGVKSIEYWAFAGCTSLDIVFIPPSVTSIGYYAFANCSSLTRAVLSSNLEKIENSLFYGCTSLAHVYIPASVTIIGPSAFEGCTSLESVTIPEGTQTIGSSCFKGCSGLQAVNISKTVTSIGDGAFSLCNNLTDFTVDTDNPYYQSDDGVLIRSDGPYLMQYPCGKNKKNYTIPDTVKYIDNCAFEQCNGLISVVIPYSVKSIGEHAFEGCSNLTSVTILSDDITISQFAFSSCNKLTNLSVNENIFQNQNGVLFRNNRSCLVLYPCGLNDSYDIPVGVTDISDSAFSGCSNLDHVSIPKSVNTIGISAFSGCSNLKELMIPSGVAGIMRGTFDGCSSLGYIAIPQTVTTIERNAFNGCNNLIAVNYLGYSDPGIKSDPFESCESFELLCVPSNYSSGTLYTRKDLFRTDSCEAVMDQIDQCFGVISDKNGITTLGLRKNVSAVEKERKRCVTPMCQKSTAVFECKGGNGNKEICDDDVCINCEQCEERKWTVTINTTSFNESSTTIVSEISDSSGVDADDISISVETDDNGQIIKIVVYVSDKNDAEKIKQVVSACAAQNRNTEAQLSDITQRKVFGII